MAVNIVDRTSKGSLKSFYQSGLVSSMEAAEAFDAGDTKVQHYGLLMKKPFGHKSGRWQKRFVRSLVCSVNALDCPRRVNSAGGPVACTR